MLTDKSNLIRWIDVLVAATCHLNTRKPLLDREI